MACLLDAFDPAAVVLKPGDAVRVRPPAAWLPSGQVLGTRPWPCVAWVAGTPHTFHWTDWLDELATTGAEVTTTWWVHSNVRLPVVCAAHRWEAVHPSWLEALTPPEPAEPECSCSLWAGHAPGCEWKAWSDARRRAG